MHDTGQQPMLPSQACCQNCLLLTGLVAPQAVAAQEGALRQLEDTKLQLLAARLENQQLGERLQRQQGVVPALLGAKLPVQPDALGVPGSCIKDVGRSSAGGG